MDDVEQFTQDVREGRIGTDRLVELVVTLQRQLQVAQRRIEELEKKAGGPPTTKVDQPFSLRAEERRQEARGKNLRPDCGWTRPLHFALTSQWHTCQ